MSLTLDANGHAALTLTSNTGVTGELVIEFPGGTPTDIGMLQVYRGPTGNSGGTVVAVATQSVGGYRCMRFDSAGQLQYADCNDLTHARWVLGVTRQAYDAGADVDLHRFAELDDPTWAWDTTLPVYLGHAGVFTQTVPTHPDAAFMLVLGMPLSATKLLVNVGQHFVLS